MIKLRYGTQGQVRFGSLQDYYYALGFLANRKNADLRWENNEEQGAWGSEGRIHCLVPRPQFPNFFRFTAGRGRVYARINCNEYVGHLVDSHNFSYNGRDHDLALIVSTVPEDYRGAFWAGYEANLSPGEDGVTKWSEEETILAFYYSCMTPLGMCNKDDPKIQKIASLLGKPPVSICHKIDSLSKINPDKRAGKNPASWRTDEKVASHFFDNWEELTYKAHSIEDSLHGKESQEESPLPVGEDREQVVKTRVNQQFFRDSVLSAYRQKCCITGIGVPALLNASHIKPWAVSEPETERTNPCNGLCLNALHDRAFDRGLITVLPDFSVRVSSKLRAEQEEEGMRWLLLCDRQKISLPDRFVPRKEFLEYHNDVIFTP